MYELSIDSKFYADMVFYAGLDDVNLLCKGVCPTSIRVFISNLFLWSIFLKRASRKFEVVKYEKAKPGIDRL